MKNEKEKERFKLSRRWRFNKPFHRGYKMNKSKTAKENRIIYVVVAILMILSLIILAILIDAKVRGI